MRYPNPTSLKAKVKRARGKNKQTLAQHLVDQQVGSLDNEIATLERRIDEHRQRINELTDRRNKIITDFMSVR